MGSEKQAYAMPRLVVYGRVEDITRSSNQVNSDTPAGNNNTAFPPHS